jgi:uncharacterized Zn-binding protein involved in type VI secretion
MIAMKSKSIKYILTAVILLCNVIISNAQPAARIGDMHVCPLVTPGVPPIPHVGGPIMTGCPTVLIGGMPAARMGDFVSCVGPPDVIAIGSVSVLICGKPAARMGDPTMHGGTIVSGLPTVLIGSGSGKGIAETALINDNYEPLKQVIFIPSGETIVKEPH